MSAERSDSVWYITKPVSEAEFLASVATACATPEASSRILLADDAEEMRGLVQAFLGDAHQIDCAEHGLVAIDKFKAGRYDLVVADLEMPVMDGRALISAIRQWEREGGRPPTPVVVLTGHPLQAQACACVWSDDDAGRERQAALRLRSGQARIMVTPDEAIRSIVPAFLTARREDVHTLWRALAGGDYALIEGIGHRLKGSGGSYGFDGITDIGRALEDAAKARHAAGLERQIEALHDYLQCVQIEEWTK